MPFHRLTKADIDRLFSLLDAEDANGPRRPPDRVIRPVFAAAFYGYVGGWFVLGAPITITTLPRFRPVSTYACAATISSSG